MLKVVISVSIERRILEPLDVTQKLKLVKSQESRGPGTGVGKDRGREGDFNQIISYT
jgi:hypothetical protein